MKFKENIQLFCVLFLLFCHYFGNNTQFGHCFNKYSLCALERLPTKLHCVEGSFDMATSKTNVKLKAKPQWVEKVRNRKVDHSDLKKVRIKLSPDSTTLSISAPFQLREHGFYITSPQNDRLWKNAEIYRCKEGWMIETPIDQAYLDKVIQEGGFRFQLIFSM